MLIHHSCGRPVTDRRRRARHAHGKNVVTSKFGFFFENILVHVFYSEVGKFVFHMSRDHVVCRVLQLA
jgi:hypothetical protein